MDEDTMLQLISEYSGSWKDRQYLEHIIGEIQKKYHLLQLILDHNHNPRDQLMLEVSKRKTVIEIDKKYQLSAINSTYMFPRNHQKVNENNSDFLTDGDSYNNSLDVDFYNLKSQNKTKKKTAAEVLKQINKYNGNYKISQNSQSTHNSKSNANQSQLSNDSNCLSQIQKPQQKPQNFIDPSIYQLNKEQVDDHINKEEGTQLKK